MPESAALMEQLVLHHTYIGGSTFDVSGKGNHGIPHAVVAGSGDTAGSFRFGDQESAITVRPSPSLRDLRSLRVRVRFRSEPWFDQRRNLVEGYLSFALVLEGGGRLTGTVVDASGAWQGVSVEGRVTAGQWYEAALEHNGLSTLALRVGGEVVAVRHDVPGPVRSVGDLGVAIGRWPDRAQYTFRGEIGELQIWRHDPVRTVQQVLDGCCGRDTALLEQALGLLAGADLRTDMRAAAREAEAAAIEFFHSVRGAGEEHAREFERLATELWDALVRRDRDRIHRVRERARAFLSENSGEAALAEWGRRSAELAERLGFGAAQRDAMLQALCLDVLRPPTTPDPRPWQEPPGGPWDEVRTPEDLTFPEQEVDQS